MRFKNGPQLPGAGRTRAWHHHGSHTPTSSEAVLLGKMAYHTKQIRRECTSKGMTTHSHNFSGTGGIHLRSFSVMHKHSHHE